MVRGSPKLLAYQPVIYVKILAKRAQEREPVPERPGAGRGCRNEAEQEMRSLVTYIGDNDNPCA